MNDVEGPYLFKKLFGETPSISPSNFHVASIGLQKIIPLAFKEHLSWVYLLKNRALQCLKIARFLTQEAVEFSPSLFLCFSPAPFHSLPAPLPCKEET